MRLGGPWFFGCGYGYRGEEGGREGGREGLDCGVVRRDRWGRG